MPKEIFSQCMCLLTDGGASIAAVRGAIEEAGFQVVGETRAATHWQHSGRSLVVPYRREVGGEAHIDIIPQPWPDEMGDPKSAMDTFGAWTMGFSVRSPIRAA